MSNKTQIECYFKSADLAKLCKGCEDIVVHFRVSYHADAPPKFEIFASQLKGGVKAGKSLKYAATGDGTSDTVPGCPTPCK